MDKDTVSTTGKAIDPGGVDHPAHYNTDPSGIECIEIVRWMSFNIGSAFKYIFRAGLKVLEGDELQAEIKDLKKALWYIRDEVAMYGVLGWAPNYNVPKYHLQVRAVAEHRNAKVAEIMMNFNHEFWLSAIRDLEAYIEELEKK